MDLRNIAQEQELLRVYDEERNRGIMHKEHWCRYMESIRQRLAKERDGAMNSSPYEGINGNTVRNASL